MDKRIKSKSLLYSIIILLIIAIIIVFWMLLKRNPIPKIVLIGNESETIYVNEEYNDPGYNVLNEDGSVYKGNVEITSNLNINQIGTYEIFYNVILNSKVIASAKRTIMVIANPLTNITLTLNGESVEYIFKHDIYQEKGATAFNDGIDVTDNIIIEGNVDTSTQGEYNITYKIIIDGIEKKIIRTVRVVDVQIIHTIDSKNKMINLNVYSEDFDYVILPNNQKITSNQIEYSIEKNGTYKFIVYTKGNLYKEYDVSVLNVEKPTGSCQAILDGSSTEFKIVNGSDNIAKYQFSGIDFYTTDYKLNYEVTNPVVRFYSSGGNYTDITCSVKRIFNNNMKYITLSKTLTPCNNNWESYNNELAKLISEAGLKTRTSVAIAADYLARFDYKVAYSWGGKSLSFGINPKWGCEASVTKDSCTKTTGNLKCIYGMDCTGYTAWAFFQAGFEKNILRTSSQSEGMWGNFNASKHKYSFSGNQNMVSQIKPGDIVWTEGHVGMVIGTSDTLLKVANMREGIRISYLDKRNGRSTNGDRDFTHFVLFDEFFNMYGSNE